MKIGELAGAASTPTETIRFYEREGLLPGAGRSESNYRIYGDAHVQRLSFIRHCRSLDMTLDEIRALLRFKDAPGEDCAGVNALLDAHVAHVAERIRELKSLQRELASLRDQCRSSAAASECGILSGLSQAAQQARPVAARQGVHVHGTHRKVGAGIRAQAENPG